MCISPKDAEKIYSLAKIERFKLGLNTANKVFKSRLKHDKNHASWNFEFNFEDVINRIALKYKENGWHVRVVYYDNDWGDHRSLNISTVPFKKSYSIFKKVKDY